MHLRPAFPSFRHAALVLLAWVACAPAATASTPKTAFSGSKPVAMEVGTPDAKQPVAMEADGMGYDKDAQIVVAEGNVEVVQGEYILRADHLTYFQQQGIVRADGNVSVLQPSGDVYFADTVELTGDMKSGVIANFRSRLADDSVFAANSAQRINPALTQMQQAVYSPCKLCEGKDPFWQMKASDVEVDNIDETVTYTNARLEFAGVPVFYSPYFSHPTPDAGPKNGILIPEYKQSSLLGTTVRVPYYWRLAPDKELTLTPWYMSDAGALLETDYAQVTDRGEFSLNASGTLPQDDSSLVGDDFRGHIFARGVQNRSDYSRWGFDVERATDDTYLRRYGFGSQYSLTSRLYAETAVGRSYALAESMLFQGLRETDDSSTTPRILPNLSGYYETDPGSTGARLHAGINMQNLTRPVGATYQRASFSTGVSQPYVTDNGHVFEAQLNLRGDVYKVNDVSITGETDTYSGDATRSVPQAALTWRYPLVTRIDDASLTIEPIAVAVAQPNGGNPVEIPNEDNRVVELTDTNIFAIDRMPGYDTIDSGSRVAYGMRSQMLLPGGQTVDGMLGQSYNASETPFPNSRTLGEEFSDYIGRVGLTYDPVTFSYRFALDRETLAATRSELWSTYAGKRIQLTGAYLTIKNSPYVSDSEEVLASTLLKLDDEWSLYGSGRRDLRNDAMVTATGGVIYTNECFSLLTQLERIYTRDRDIEPSTEFSVRLGFKNFGEFGNN